MPEEVKEEVKTESNPKAVDAILHSFPKDRRLVSGEVVDNPHVPDQEAIMLADIQVVSNKRRQISFFRNITILVVLVAVLIFIFPKIFTNIVNENNQKNTLNNIKKDTINFDIKYSLQIPKQNDLDKFRTQSFKLSDGFTQFVVKDNNDILKFNQLNPIVDKRFIDGIDTISNGDYFYVAYTKENISYPFIVLSVKDFNNSEKFFLEKERTMYTDLGNILHLENNTENETRNFENFQSVVNPLRELKDKNQNTVLVYGFANDNTVIFTVSKDAFVAIKQRIILGY